MNKLQSMISESTDVIKRRNQLDCDRKHIIYRSSLVEINGCFTTVKRALKYDFS